MVDEGFTRCQESQLRWTLAFIGLYDYHRRSFLVHNFYFPQVMSIPFPLPLLSMIMVASRQQFSPFVSFFFFSPHRF